MDPEATLETMARMTARVRRMTETGEVEDLEALTAAAEELARAVGAMDEWLRRGGAVPEAWRR